MYLVCPLLSFQGEAGLSGLPGREGGEVIDALQEFHKRKINLYTV